MLAASVLNFEVSRAHWRTSRGALIAVPAGSGSLFKYQQSNPDGFQGDIPNPVVLFTTSINQLSSFFGLPQLLFYHWYQRWLLQFVFSKDFSPHLDFLVSSADLRKFKLFMFAKYHGRKESIASGEVFVQWWGVLLLGLDRCGATYHT